MACGEMEKAQPAADMSLDPRDKPSQTSHHALMSFSSNAQMRALLRAQRIRVYEQKRYTMLDSGVRVDFYDKLGKHSSYLTSLSAMINDANKDMTAYDSVRIVSDSGTVVDTDSLQWLNGTQMMHSDADVKIVERNGRITRGRGFISDQSLDHYTILFPIILTPKNQFQVGTDPNDALRPETPTVPAQNAITGPSTFSLPASPIDSSKLINRASQRLDSVKKADTSKGKSWEKY